PLLSRLPQRDPSGHHEVSGVRHRQSAGRHAAARRPGQKKSVTLPTRAIAARTVQNGIVGFFALALTAQLVVDHGAGSHGYALAAGKPVDTPALAAHLDKAPAGALDEYTLTITYRQPANVRRETLEIELAAPSGARAIFRDGRLRDLNGTPTHMDAFGPK